MVFPGDCLQVIGSDEQLTMLSNEMRKEVYEEDIDIENREMKLKQIVITHSSPFIGKTLQESGIRERYNCMVVGIEEGKKNLSQVKPTRIFNHGDIIWMVGEDKDITRILNEE